MDDRAKEACQIADANGDCPPILYNCQKCGQETLNDAYCGVCQTAFLLYLTNHGMSEDEAEDLLYNVELDSWYSRAGY